jgi:bifunctional DNA-binding transcriptional regulator/antitoxin component of YhaV-PrlF toxin-antitoxin module
VAISAKVPMCSFGRLSIPAAARRALGIVGEAEFDVEVVDDRIVLRPSAGPLDNDDWAYTPRHRRLLRRALKDSEEGRVRRMAEQDLRALAPVE